MEPFLRDPRSCQKSLRISITEERNGRTSDKLKKKKKHFRTVLRISDRRFDRTATCDDERRARAQPRGDTNEIGSSRESNDTDEGGSVS